MTTIASRFAPELILGLDALDDELRSELVGYLGKVIAARGFPLHVNVAWNALMFGYDPERGSYPDKLLSESNMPRVGLGATGEALPLGAIVWVDVGGRLREVWAEVVGKEGRPSGVEDGGWATPELAGRQAERQAVSIGDDPTSVEGAVLDEALVCDFEAFGPMEGLDKVLARLTSKGRLADHRLVAQRATYIPPEGAEDSDAAFYVRWLFDKQPELLRCSPLAAALIDRSDEALRSATVDSLTTVDLLLSQVPGVVRWGDYALLQEWVDELDLSPNLPGHAADLQHLIGSLASGSGVVAKALAPALSPFLGSGQTDPLRPDQVAPDPMAGVGYLKVVATTSRWIADHIDELGGVVTSHGNHRLLRVDDTWTWGGLWRSEPWGPGHPLTDVPPDEPLRIGSRGYGALAEFLEEPLADILAPIEAATAPPSPEAVAEPDEEPVEDESQSLEDDDRRSAEEDDAGDTSEDAGSDDGGEPEEEPEPDLEATLVSASVTLRQADLNEGTLPLPGQMEWLKSHDSVAVKLSHEGDLDSDQADQEAKPDPQVARLARLDWPLDFFAGIRLNLTAIAGGRVVFATTTVLEEPVEVDGYPFPLGFAFDPAVVGRDCPAPEPTLVDIAVRALSRHGRLASDNTRRASASDVTRFCFGPSCPPQLLSTITEILYGLVDSGRLTLIGSQYTWSPHSRGPRRREILPTSWEPVVRLRAGAVRQHWVQGFLRLLPLGWSASEQAGQLYQDARAAGAIPLWYPPELPDGYTYVSGHERGQRRGAYYEALHMIVSEGDGRSPGRVEMEQLAEEWEAEG